MLKQCVLIYGLGCNSLDKSITEDNADYVIRQNTDFPWDINCKHLIYEFTNHISKSINIKIPQRFIRPVIYPELPEKSYFDFPYIVLNTGWQNSVPVKKWLKSYWQKLVDICPNLRFVEIGKSQNHPAYLSNVINLIDKTDRLQLLHVIRDSIAVISPPSAPIHIAAAFNKPFINICGRKRTETFNWLF